MNYASQKAVERVIRRYFAAAVLACLLLVGGAGSLAAVVELAGAVVAGGTLVVDSNVKKVQHPTGGVIHKIFVREGDRVKEGDLLIQLDDTLPRANLAIVSKSLDELHVRVARLEAERDGRDDIDFSGIEDRQDPQVARLIAGEQSLFEFRKQARLGQKAQLEERIQQLNQQIIGFGEQQEATRKEIELVGTELESVRTLWRQGLMSLDRMTATERQAVNLQGTSGRLTAAVAQAKGQIAEIRLQIIQVDQNMRSEVASDLRDAQAKIAELVERKVAAEDAVKHIELRSPQDGFIHELAVYTVGGVVKPAEPIMLIVPAADKLLVEARIAPQDIDQIAVGQNTSLRLSAFNRQTTPILNGIVERVSPDLVTDQRTGASYYTARIALPADEKDKLQGLVLTPGMPAEVFFETGERTMLSYLIKPIEDQAERAFRED